MTTPTDIEDHKRAASIRSIRAKASDLINALHDHDGSRRGAGFNSAVFGRARDSIEAAVMEATE